MPQFQTWEEFSRAAEKLYLADPMRPCQLSGPWEGTRSCRMLCSILLHKVTMNDWARVVLKYRHSDGSLCIKVTDDLVCLVYRTDQAQDVKKIEKFHSQLMRLMVAKESRSVAMETD
uniref:Signal recognition particle 9 kDa protein n=1 Tax=Myotis myotis TaxID=51298 RepID=A0A7J7RV69_MYOMY|nr:signal recognition particle 9 [Myotis myotis]